MNSHKFRSGKVREVQGCLSRHKGQGGGQSRRHEECRVEGTNGEGEERRGEKDGPGKESTNCFQSALSWLRNGKWQRKGCQSAQTAPGDKDSVHIHTDD